MNAEAIQKERQKKNGRVREILRAAGLSIAVLALVAAQNAAKTHEEAAPAARPVDRAAAENLQRWVSGGHDAWCKDARMVASAELRRVAPEFSGDESELTALELEQEFASGTRQVFTWTSLDGHRTYRVVLERYSWLLPIAGKADGIVWVPAGTEVRAND